MGRARLSLSVRRAGALGFATAALGSFVAATSCTRTQHVTVVLHVPSDVKDRATSFEIGLYGTETCPSIAQLAGGLAPGGLVQRIGFGRRSDAPTFNVPKGTYSFAASARDDSCEVLAAGCTAIATSGTHEVAIDLKTVEGKAGRCMQGSQCVGAECVPAPTRDDEGAGCTLEVVGAGPLQNVIVSGGDINVGTPAIAAVNDGFVIAYRQVDADKYRLITMKVGFDGGPVRADDTTALPFNNYDVKGACPDDITTEGLSLAFPSVDATSGILVAPRGPACTSAAVTLHPTASNAHFVGDGVPITWDSRAPPPSKHVATNRAFTPIGYATSVIDGQARVYTLATTATAALSGVDVGGPGPHHHSWIAASDHAVGALVEADRAPTGGGDPDAGGDGGSGDPTITARTELRLSLAEIGTSTSPTFQTMAPIIPRTIGSIAVSGGRFAIASNGPAAAPVELRIVDIGDADFREVAVPSSEITSTLGDTVGVDLAISGDRLIVATMQGTGVSVLAFKDFGSNPAFIKRKALASDSKVKPFMGGIFEALRDGAVGIAATGGRVGVVWTTGKRVSLGEELGGWAVLSCN